MKAHLPEGFFLMAGALADICHHIDNHITVQQAVRSTRQRHRFYLVKRKLLARLRPDLRELQKITTAMRIPMAGRLCEEILSQLPRRVDDLDLADLRAKVDDIALRVQHTLACQRFFQIDDSDAEYLEQPQLSTSVLGKIPTCEQDAIMVGRCFAFELYPAVVFHSMRIVDAAIKALAEHYRLKPKTPNWAELIRALQTKRDTFKKRDRNKYRHWSSLVEQVTVLKEATRNPIMHSDQEYPVDSMNRLAARYTKPEAARILANMQALTEQIAALLP